MKHWWRQRPLHIQLLLVSSLLMLLTLMATTYWSVEREKQRLLEDHLQQDQSLAQMVALSSTYHVIARRLDELESLLLKFALFPSVVDLAVMDEQGNILSRIRTSDDGPVAAYDQLRIPVPEAARTQGRLVLAHGSHIELWQAIQTSTRLGWVRLLSDSSDIQQKLDAILWDNLFNATLLLMLDLLVLLFILRAPGRTFRSAVRFATHLPNAPGSHLQLEGGSREINDLIQALNRSSDELQSGQLALQTLNAELEQRVQRRTEALLDSQENNLLLRKAIEQTTVGMVMLDEQFRLTDSNSAFHEMTGLSREQLQGQNLLERLWSPLNPPGLKEDLFQHLEAMQRWQGECITSTGPDRRLWLGITVTPVEDHHGTRHYLLAMENITERKAYEEQLIHQANYDDLTGLPNRVLGMDRLARAIQRDQRRGNKTVLMFLDLDHFKAINDTLGHRTGDRLLIEAAGRLTACIREEDTVARLGGDEFLVILSGAHDPATMEAVANKILQQLEQPFYLDGRELRVGVSIGIAVAPDDSADPETLLRFADTAMYQAKQEGRHRFHYYTPAMNRAAFERLRIDQALHKALEADEFSLYMQPIVQARNGTIAGAEALIRWSAGELGPISPDTFIPIAEENGLIVPIGRWVLFRACHQAMAWKHNGFVSINVAYQQFRDSQFISDVREALEITGLPAERLHLEITERVLMLDEERLAQQIQALHKLGVRFSIDDFGTGYSSLSYLCRFPCHTLKIDRSFVQTINQGKRDANAVIKAIINMGHALGLEIVAEGVENDTQVQFLRQYGCDLLQGYLYARPMPEQEYKLLEEQGICPSPGCKLE